MKKSIFLTLLLIIGFISCDNCQKGRYFKITDIHYVHQSYNNNQFNFLAPPNERIRVKDLQGHRNVSYRFYVMMLDLQTKFISSTQTGGFINAAYANEPDCAKGRLGLKLEQQLRHIEIVTENDYNAFFPAGSIINDMIEYNYVGRRPSEWQPIQFNPEWNMRVDLYHDEPIVFRLTEAPAENRVPHLFSIHLYFKDGTKQVISANDVILTK